jgi:hypothetical protein
MSKERERLPWDGTRGGLRDAIYRLHKTEVRAPTEQDIPPASTFPMTPAAREALRLNREHKRRQQQKGAT